MKIFRVWVRTLGNASRVRVEGNENTNWLIGRLSQSFIFKTSHPLQEDRASSSYTFQVPYSSRLTRAAFEKLLAGIPEVQLLADPA